MAFRNVDILPARAPFSIVLAGFRAFASDLRSVARTTMRAQPTMAKKMQSRLPDKHRKKEEKPNLFESLYSRKKFDILGKRSKGEQRQIGRARIEGTEKRKNTLLVEYKQRQRANSFLDRRFGENAEELTADDKAIARFQKQRLKELAGSKYNLSGTGEGEQLTHLGASLADNADMQLDATFEDQDMVDKVDHQLASDLHFGGGFVRRSNDANDERPKSRNEVMEEIIAKSKAFKAEKAKQREADLDATEALDRDLAKLMGTGALHRLIKPKGSRHNAKASVEVMDAAYDRSRRELVFEAKAQVSERRKTVEEVAVADAQRLQVLEQQRRKRMLSGDNDEESLPGTQYLGGGYAARRVKRQKLDPEASGDTDKNDLQTDSEDSQEEANKVAIDRRISRQQQSLDERRVERAAGHHPLQERFRAVSGHLLKKFGVETTKGGTASSKGVESKSTSSEEGSAENSEEDTGSKRSPDNARSPGTEITDKEKAEERSRKYSAIKVQPAAEGQQNATFARPLSQDAAISAHDPNAVDKMRVSPTSNSTASLELHPQTYDQFAELVAGKPAVELRAEIQRMRMKSSSAGEGNSKRKLQILFGILVQHFANRAGIIPPSMAELDILTAELLELTPEVPLYAATTAIARLQRLQERLSLQIRGSNTDPSGAARTDCWPSQRQLLLLKLWATVFPVSDRRHAVLTPAALLVASYLALCPVRSLKDMVSGLFLCSLGLHMADAAKRLMPEPLSFAVGVLLSAVDQHGPARAMARPTWTCRLMPDGGWNAAHESNKPLTLNTDLGATNNEALPASCLKAAIGVIGRAADIFSNSASFPEFFEVPQQLLWQVRDATSRIKDIKSEAERVIKKIRTSSEEALRHRRALRREKIQKEVKQYNPRFEEEFAVGKDYDPDRERAEARKLKRLLTKERRGAMRELRKDAIFLGEQAGREKDSERASLKGTLQGNNAWIQRMEQDFRSGGQGGMWRKKLPK